MSFAASWCPWFENNLDEANIFSKENTDESTSKENITVLKENRLLLEIFISHFHKQSWKCSGRNSPGKGVKIHIKTTMPVSLFNK